MVYEGNYGRSIAAVANTPVVYDGNVVNAVKLQDAVRTWQEHTDLSTAHRVAPYASSVPHIACTSIAYSSTAQRIANE
eukprot:1458752-Rhodomonas_salina.1